MPSCPDIILIVVDDGSTDNTREILEDYERRGHVNIIIRNSLRSGISKSRNLGISCCGGVDYVMFLDADDKILSDGLCYINTTKSVSDLVLFPFRKVERRLGLDDKFTSVDFRRHGFDLGQALVDYSRAPNKAHLITTCWSKLYRKSILDQTNGLRFDESMSICEDTKFFFDFLSVAHSVSYVNELSYEHNISRGPRERATFGFGNSYISIFAFVRAVRSWRRALIVRNHANTADARLMAARARSVYLIIYFIRSGAYVRGPISFIRRWMFFRRVFLSKSFKSSLTRYCAESVEDLPAPNIVLRSFIKNRLYFLAALMSYFIFLRRYRT